MSTSVGELSRARAANRLVTLPLHPPFPAKDGIALKIINQAEEPAYAGERANHSEQARVAPDLLALWAVTFIPST
jgi:hypothetical protein